MQRQQQQQPLLGVFGGWNVFMGHGGSSSSSSSSNRRDLEHNSVLLATSAGSDSQLIAKGMFIPVATAAAVVTISWCFYYYFYNKKTQHQQQDTRGLKLPPRRRASYTSLGLALGTFPEQANVPEPIINAVCYFRNKAELPTEDDIVTTMIVPLLNKYERLSHIFNTNTGYYELSTAPSYEPKDLIRTIEINTSTLLAEDRNDVVLNQTIFDHVHDKFNSQHKRPWWEIMIVQNNNMNCRSAIVLRIHHTLADGLSLVHAFTPLLISKQDQRDAAIVDETNQVSGDEIDNSNKPRKQMKAKVSYGKVLYSLIEGTIHVLTLGLSKYDDKTAFTKCIHPNMKVTQRDFIIFPTISLSFIKELKSAANCTVNTIIMTAMSQAIHDYCIQEQDPILSNSNTASNVQCRALLPVGFPRSKKELSNPQTALTNKWCVVSCNMHTGYVDIIDRLQHIHTSTSQLKDSLRAYMQLLIQNTIAPLLPKSIARQAVMDVFTRHSILITNVPGPTTTCTIGNQSVHSIQLFFSNLLPQTNIISYSNFVYGNIVYDPIGLPKFKSFGIYYARAFIQMAERLNVVPPDELLAIIDNYKQERLVL